MTWRIRIVLALLPAALGAACAARPGAAPPPSPVSSSCAAAPVVPDPCALPPLSEAQASAELAARGYIEVHRLEPVGDYWQGETAGPSGAITVYVLPSGRVLHMPPPVGAS